MIRRGLGLLLLACCRLTAAAEVSSWIEPGTGMEFVLIGAGCFAMGTDPAVEFKSDDQLRQLGVEESRFADERPVHRACLSGFWLGRHEVTAAQWQHVMGTPPPAGTGKRPAAGVSWHDARRFVERLTGTGTGRFRLPTEAEWEYACRELDAAKLVALQPEDRMNQAWYSLNERRPAEAAEVGRLSPSAAGLYDILGNVWEWTGDAYVADSYALAGRRASNSADAAGPRSVRGGSFRSDFLELRCANRGSYPSDQGLDQIGLRVLREAE